MAFPVQAVREMQWSIKHTGAFFSVMSLFMVVVQGAILPRLSRTWSDKRLVCVGAFVLGFGFLALTPAGDWMAFVGAILIAVGNGLMWPPVVALLSKTAGKIKVRCRDSPAASGPLPASWDCYLVEFRMLTWGIGSSFCPRVLYLPLLF